MRFCCTDSSVVAKDRGLASSAALAIFEQKLNKARRLADKQTVRGQGVRKIDGIDLALACWPNDSAMRQASADELARHGEDQVRLQQRISGGIEVRKQQSSVRVGERSPWSLHRVARKVRPFEEVRHLISTITEHNAQDLRLRNELAKGRVKAGATQLDKAEVKGRRVGQGLCVGCWSEIGIGYWDGRKHSIGELRNRLSERSARIRVCRAAIACIPTGVDGELCQVG